MIKFIKTENDYEQALVEINKLMALDPDADSSEGEQLHILALLIQEYESNKYSFCMPVPIQAIKFRMEQQNLTPRDLIPYLGSRSKVSEILSGKRTLTLSMIKSLHSGLGIPAEVLLQDSSEEDSDIEWEHFPIKEMIKRGWINNDISKIKSCIENVLLQFLAETGIEKPFATLYRKSDHVRSARSMDEYSLLAWTARVIIRSKDNAVQEKFPQDIENLKFMRKVAQLSWSENGPILAQEYLKKHGIALVVESHLPKTYLDGAAIIVDPEKPIIGLTLRYDRIDNFWFTLIHELAHICLHIKNNYNKFYDDLDVDSQNDLYEQEADEMAGEALIPQDVWVKSPASRLRSPEAAQHLAKQLGIHPAIVAGRMRYEFKAFRMLNNLVGHGEVRKLFTNLIWEK